METYPNNLEAHPNNRIVLMIVKAREYNLDARKLYHPCANMIWDALKNKKLYI